MSSQSTSKHTIKERKPESKNSRPKYNIERKGDSRVSGSEPKKQICTRQTCGINKK